MQKEVISLHFSGWQSFCTLIFVSTIRCFIIPPPQRTCAGMKCYWRLWFAQTGLSKWDLWGEGILFLGWKKRKKIKPLPCRDNRTHSFLIRGSLTSVPCWGESSSNSKPKAGSSDTLSSPCPSPSFSYQFSWSNFSASSDQLKRKLWTLSIIRHSPRPFLLGNFPIWGLFSLSLSVSPPLHTTSVSLGEFCLCLWAFLFLFSSQKPSWDSIFIHPSSQRITVETRSAISPSCWRHQLWFCTHVALFVGYFLFPVMLQENGLSELGLCFFPSCQPPCFRNPD